MLSLQGDQLFEDAIVRNNHRKENDARRRRIVLESPWCARFCLPICDGIDIRALSTDMCTCKYNMLGTEETNQCIPVIIAGDVYTRRIRGSQFRTQLRAGEADFLKRMMSSRGAL